MAAETSRLSPQEQVAAQYLEHKGIRAECTDVVKVEEQDCWYFYYAIDGGTLELEIFYDKGAWHTQSFFQVT